MAAPAGPNAGLVEVAGKTGYAASCSTQVLRGDFDGFGGTAQRKWMAADKEPEEQNP